MSRAAFLLLPLFLAGCGGASPDTQPPAPVDAAISDALADPIMTDPDLVAQNGAYAAVAVSGPVRSALPPINRDAAAIGAARDEASALLGGAIPAASAPSSGDLTVFREAVTAVQMASIAQVANPGCIQNAAYTARWAAVLPVPLQVYPRGAVEEAVGTDAGGCALRVVHFKTPVAVDDVLAFHYARLRAAGYPVEHIAEGADHLLRGRKGSASYTIYVRKDQDGLTAADIIVAGS
ncbi:hypothetical protein KRR38_26720 [Novosphingobium sp. G106]|uniref:hypothetical protein n=1 Tax=Novosphingobium sp. G106 TaxID=2849500 RepID=UPI001C2D866D|nr:hypothetical protein [Novosphingobium sp. G106]MBV1691177.1 hypothetical protein [Novosphingobium sp. G106]